VARVGVAAVEALGREFRSDPADLIVAIGPAIGPCCYEVGPDVVDAFATAGHERYLIDRWFIASPPPRGVLGTPHGGPGSKLRLDVPGANRDQLILAGVREDNIHVAGLCTAMHLDLLTSYRAEKERAGRIAGVIKAHSASHRSH
jgi:copper oxidase (laccase) domain-containing protein